MVEVWQLFVITSALTVIIGLYCVASKRNMIKTVIGVEIITSGINLNFLAFGYGPYGQDPLAQSVVITSIVIAAAVAAVALSIVINAYRHYGSVDVKKLSRLRW